MKTISVVASLVVFIWLATDSIARETVLPDIAVVNRNDEGAIVGIRLTGKSNRERLTLSTETIDSLSQLTELESLSLWGTTVGDDDLRKLKSLKQLRTIDLSFTDVTGASLQTLSALENLVSVRFDSCDVTDQHLAELESMPQLAMLYLRATKVTDRGLKHLRFLDQLLLLELSDCKISDAGLISLGDLPVIQHLWLSKTIRHGTDDRSDLTDNCVDYLSTLDSLLDLRIADSRITEPALEQLRRALPNTTINTTRTGVTYLSSKK